MDIKPLANWDDEASSHENLIWWSRLDKRYQIEVQRVEKQTLMCIFDRDNEMKLLQEPTQLPGPAYDAAFGPDVMDIQDWMSKAIAIVDGKKEEERKNE